MPPVETTRKQGYKAALLFYTQYTMRKTQVLRINSDKIHNIQRKFIFKDLRTYRI